ncbi:MAG: ABC transporter ATP-binding protein [Christensenellales bacterium]
MKNEKTITPGRDAAEGELLDIFENKTPIKTLLYLFKGNYGKLMWSTLLFFIKHSPYLAIPVVTANIINIVTTPVAYKLEDIGMNLLVIGVLLLGNIPFHYLHVKMYSKAIRRVEANIRNSLIRKLQQLSITYHKQMQSGRLQSKIIRDVEAVEQLSGQLFIGLLGIAANISVALAVMLSKSILVFSFFLLAVPVAVITIAAFGRKIKTVNKQFRREMEETSAKVMEMVELIPVTRAHGLEQQEIKKMKMQVVRVADRGYRLDLVQSLFGSVSWTSFQVFQMICLAFTGYLAFIGKISVGEVVLYQTYYVAVVNQVANLVNFVPVMAKGLESVSSIGEVLLSTDLEHNSGKYILKDIRGEILFKNVSFTYNDRGAEQRVLSDFNLCVKAGETVALVGESGAGKTTLLNLVIGFLKPESGYISIDGKKLEDIDLKSLRKHLAVVPQNTILFSGTIRDNITYGMMDVSESKLQNIIKAANLEDMIQSLPDGLETVIGEHGDNLSGGQRQRISIARALIRNPQIILLDEATSALDSVSEKKIQSALLNLTANRTTLIVAHRFSTIRDADKIALVGDGRCSEFGTYDELMAKKGAFYALKRLQM